MSTDHTPHQLDRLQAVRDAFDEWRRSRKKRSPIPVDLWHAAANLSPFYPTHQIAKALRGCLKIHFECEPGGFAAISRWLSPHKRAIPPEGKQEDDCTPEGCRQGCLRPPPGSYPTYALFRGYRPTASPPG